MADRVKQIWDRIREFFGKMKKGTKILLIVVLVLTIAAIGALVYVQSTRPYAVLFSQLSSEDMTSVMAYLNERGITDFRVSNNDTILVRSDLEPQLKADIMMQGYPTTGYGYDTYFNNVGILSSESDRQVLELFTLQDRLGAVITKLPGVRDAQVFITQGEDRRYILSTDDVVEASASVIVEMNSGLTMSQDAAEAIRRLVTNAVSGLKISKVEITDNYGNSYADTSTSTTSSSTSSQLKLALEEQVNNLVRENVQALLNRMFGAENVSLSVHSTVDITRMYRDSTIYEEPTWATGDGQGIIGTRVWDNSLVRGDEEENAGGVVGTTTNADLNEYVIDQAQLNGDETAVGTSGSIDYNVTTHHQQQESLGGTVTDLTVAVAINNAVVEVPNMDTMTHLVAVAAGITQQQEAQKIAIVAYPFYQQPEEDDGTADRLQLPAWVLYAVVGSGILIIVAVYLLISLSKKRRIRKAEQKAIQQQTEEQKEIQMLEEQRDTFQEQLAQLVAEGKILEEDANQLLAQAGQQFSLEAAAIIAKAGEMRQRGANIMDVHAERSMELRRNVRQFVEENPAIAAQMIKNWLRGAEEHA